MPQPLRFSLPAAPAVSLAIVSVQGGAALAKGLFPLLGAAGTTSVRIGLSAVVLPMVRPRLGQLRPAQWRAVAPYGLILGVMNFLFYCTLARIPLGLAVTLEFVGPLGLALTGSRRRLKTVWALLATGGIALITPWAGAGLYRLEMAFALAVDACWAGYIVLGRRAVRLRPGPVAVTLGVLFAALPGLPFGAASGGLRALTPPLLLGAGLGLFFSVLPFSLEMHALKTMPVRTFSILNEPGAGGGDSLGPVPAERATHGHAVAGCRLHRLGQRRRGANQRSAIATARLKRPRSPPSRLRTLRYQGHSPQK